MQFFHGTGQEDLALVASSAAAGRWIVLRAAADFGFVHFDIVDDDVGEPAEEFTVSLEDPGGGGAAAAVLGTINSRTLTILPDDGPVVDVRPQADFGTTTVTVAEGPDAEASLTVRLDRPAPAGGVTVRYRTEAVTATSGDDYDAAGEPPASLAKLVIDEGRNQGRPA